MTRDRTGRISRRGLISSGAAASLLAASGLIATTEHRRGGTLRMALPGRTGPAPWTGRGMLARSFAPGSVFDCLTEVDAEGRLVGELAEHWAPRADGRVWDIALRDGVRFHDGRAFCAEDVIASLRRHAGPGAALHDLAGLRRLDARTVQISLAAPDAGLPFRLSLPELAMLPAADPADAFAAGIGTGIYRLAGSGAGGGTRLSRVAKHYKDGRAGWFDAVELLPTPDADARLAALLAGRVDLAAALAPRHVPLVARAARLAGRSMPVGAYLRIRAGGDAARPLAEALKLGLDRAALLHEVLDGAGRVAADHPLPPELPLPPPDPEAARRILERAGVTAATLTLGPGMADFPALDRLVRAFRVAAREIGLALAPAPAHVPGELSLEFAPAQPTDDLALAGFPSDGVPDPAALGDRLISARSLPHSTYRRAKHSEVARILAENGLTIVPFFADFSVAHRAKLTQLRHIHSATTLDSSRIAEQWHYV